MNILNWWNSALPPSIFLLEAPLFGFHGILSGVINFLVILVNGRGRISTLKLSYLFCILTMEFIYISASVLLLLTAALKTEIFIRKGKQCHLLQMNSVGNTILKPLIIDSIKGKNERHQSYTSLDTMISSWWILEQCVCDFKFYIKFLWMFAIYNILVHRKKLSVL